jgi:hypothetical protein
MTDDAPGAPGFSTPFNTPPAWMPLCPPMDIPTCPNVGAAASAAATAAARAVRLKLRMTLSLICIPLSTAHLRNTRTTSKGHVNSMN